MLIFNILDLFHNFMIQNAIGYKIYYAQRLDMAKTLRERMGYAIRYNAFRLLKKDVRYNYIGPHKWFVRFLFPLGVGAYFYYKFKE